METQINLSDDSKNWPIKTAKEILELSSVGPCSALISSEQFLELFQTLYPHSVTRRTLQLYCSPQLRLLPPPIHKGGHITYYLHPEHTDRLAVILTLQKKYNLSLETIANLIKKFPSRHYDLIFRGTLTSRDLEELASHTQNGFSLTDVIFNKICELLEALELNINPRAEISQFSPQEIEERMGKILLRRTQEFDQWLKTDQRQRMLYGDEEAMMFPTELILSESESQNPRRIKLTKVNLADRESVRKGAEIFKTKRKEGEKSEGA